MIGKVGGTIVIDSERAHATGCQGVIEDVFEEQPPRYQVRWEDGHTSILAPSGGSARIERKKPAAKGKAEEAGRGGWNFHRLDIAPNSSLLGRVKH